MNCCLLFAVPVYVCSLLCECASVFVCVCLLVCDISCFVDCSCLCVFVACLFFCSVLHVLVCVWVRLLGLSGVANAR